MLGNHHSVRYVCMRLMLALAFVLTTANSQARAGTFDKISSEVRQTNTGSSSSKSAPPPSRKREKTESRHSHAHYHEYCEDDDDNDNALAAFLAAGVLVGVTSRSGGPMSPLRMICRRRPTFRNILTRMLKEACCRISRHEGLMTR